MSDEPKQVGRRYRGEGAVLHSPEDVAETNKVRADYATKPGAVPIAAYFSTRGIDNPIMQASMLAFTVVRVATEDDFDAIFATH